MIIKIIYILITISINYCHGQTSFVDDSSFQTNTNNKSTNMLYSIFSNGLSIISDYYNFGSVDKIIADYEKGKKNEDIHLSIDEIIMKYGYTVERHHTVTADGYNLTLFRIPGKGPVVLLMHGMFSSSDVFIISGPDIGQAFLLAEEGYDVWLGNSRGNKHSRSHIKLDPSQEKFWDFSWHEIGYYDLPATIDYVLNKTGQQKLKYIGHSQGSTSFFVMASERPEYNDKISLMIALAPSVFLSRSKSLLTKATAPFCGTLVTLSKHFGVHELLPDFVLPRLLFEQLVGTDKPLLEIFTIVSVLSAGFDIPQVNFNKLPVIVTRTLAGSSVLQLCHYAQLFTGKKFKQYDHGPEENLRRYGSEIPPEYELNKVRAPVSIIYSDGDWHTHPDDLEELVSKLPNVVDKSKLKHKLFNHIDFLYAKDLKQILFRRIKKTLKKF